MGINEIRKHKLAHNAAYLVLNQLIKFSARGFYILMLAHYLGPELFGLLSYGHHWYLLFLTFSVFGMQAVISREIGRQYKIDTSIIYYSLALRLLLALISTLSCGLLGMFFEQNDLARQLILILCLALFSRSFSLWSNTICVSLEMTKPVLLTEGFWRLMEMLLGFLLIKKGFGVIELAWLHAATYCLEAVTYYAVLYKRLGLFGPAFLWPQIYGLVKLGIPTGIALFAQSWLYQGSVVMVRWLDEFSSNLGNISLLMQVLSMLTMIPFMINRALLPRLSREDKHKYKRQTAYLRAYIIYGTMTSLVICLLFNLIFSPVVEWLFGEKYHLLSTLFNLAIWGIIPLVWALAGQQLLIANGNYFTNAIALCLAAGIFSLAIVLGFPVFGSKVISFAYVAALFIWAIITWYAIFKMSDHDCTPVNIDSKLDN